jgi:Flp pilus assembly protein TadD
MQALSFLSASMISSVRCGDGSPIGLVAAFLLLAGLVPAFSQIGGMLGSVVGQVRVERGGSPPQTILVNLKHDGAIVSSVYTDSKGTYGFHQLPPDTYTISVNDEHYEPVEETAVIQATSLAPTAYLDITVRPKTAAENSAQPSTPRGANPNITDAREYASHFPKQVRKEFDKGVAADRAGKKDDAIKHYQKALALASDYYPAHNNLGSDYLSKSDFSDARKEFEEVIRLNQSDAEAYFNLSNVSMITGQLADAQKSLEEGLRREPDSALGHFLLGSLDIKTGNYSQAEAVLRQTIQLNPTMAQARLQLVNVFLQEGKQPQAEGELREFISKFPDNPFTPKARQLLERLQAAETSSGSEK